ncbi:DeoR/GlpR family DNA-binding transcription regulator [Dermatophilus congolensis]|uniref:DeoR/GlpR family DNA-binding transcription regulator n=1 Tax=Dermatophilus congolensis TaxID=1863 RepID=UPI001AAF2734|nr:DeoR/GlpR family DNA-binding transcription regulator [Dermatophilus congolensis]MBO3130083.1 DeoR/GlpR transcriptional regulator [Dermatophilus congolensis]MBO3131290.1 DeoR/GlpR transcriptional regulator [Dermatophilus congolensis]MBO3134554.1 DeoR/GlpR transcriptional regulator [Dermatophilus congolensis]MBO3136791.1 DeoR/GlpR transcriptional regulator [Dermatophilus congolensis]MBO3139035.1 DeoR/GlpR transcriptional regulator [Dermatophilus congolensis]
MERTRGTTASASRGLDGRRDRALDIVTQRGRIEVGELAALLGVSQVTVRKDLDELTRQGLLRREHGVAVANAGDDIRARLASGFTVKSRIARAAAQTVPDGETILVESGSTAALFAEELCAADRDITIITNSTFIADFVRDTTAPHIIVLGGEYQTRSQVMVGPLVAAAARNFHVTSCFIGIDGFDTGRGFCGRDIARAEAVRAMAAQAEEIVVLTDSSKFGTRAPIHLCSPTAVGRVFTDANISEEALAELCSCGVDVTTVPAEHND